MSDHNNSPASELDPVVELRARAEALEHQLAEVEEQTRSRLVSAELKVEAMRAGMVDLDGLKLLNLADVKLNERGEVDDASQLMAQLRRAKPWLFAGPSSSRAASVPPAQPPRQKLATEMTDDEYQTARTTMLKNRL